jgi:hypothetical protein
MGPYLFGPLEPVGASLCKSNYPHAIRRRPRHEDEERNRTSLLERGTFPLRDTPLSAWADIRPTVVVPVQVKQLGELT